MCEAKAQIYVNVRSQLVRKPNPGNEPRRIERDLLRMQARVLEEQTGDCCHDENCAKIVGTTEDLAV